MESRDVLGQTKRHLQMDRCERAGIWDCLYPGTPIPTVVKDGSGNCQRTARNRNESPISSLKMDPTLGRFEE